MVSLRFCWIFTSYKPICSCSCLKIMKHTGNAARCDFIIQTICFLLKYTDFRFRTMKARNHPTLYNGIL
ncbi:hypothetical protein XENTR_v10014301 [Xenopus tropicalis]|nr:hypothetical protein XENTR_v10014301 [Xenopus tropicalis]